ncbi:uncharacterized protein H6S33_010663 [Morchella sextelata]|uniref:uncharacterized protein n=1 Tax=Morchella sextelata TaxID=1174677 RepID=UPI001D0468C7|nr:uncharacterized protein H6S33_010663 [Morchella sextelata]KAH0611398.1 hypothetical protein H6S33_010663 [Morchella sextelata]
MLANKENVLIHGPSHGAGKINPKTPGPSKLNPKTPYKVSLNDEGGKSNLFAGKDPSMFITPAGPRRAALTGKTTNAKARRPPSEGEEGQKTFQKPSRLIRTRLSLTAEVVPIANEEGEYPEIEYMPPRETELPDIPDDFEIPNYERLSKHLYSNCHRQFLLDIDESGKSKIDRQLEESERQISALLDAETDQLLSEVRPKRVSVKKDTVQRSASIAAKLKHKRSTSNLADRPIVSRKRSGEMARPNSAMSNGSINSHPSTAASIRAATALSQRPPSSTSQRPPSRTHSRSISGSLTNRSSDETLRPSSRTIIRPSSRSTIRPASRPNSRMAVANSKTTIGYTTGKEVAKSVKKAFELPKRETALEVCERILREDDERQTPAIMLFNNEDDDGVDDLLKSLPSLAEVFEEEEEEFYLTLPDVE